MASENIENEKIELSTSDCQNSNSEKINLNGNKSMNAGSNSSEVFKIENNKEIPDDDNKRKIILSNSTKETNKNRLWSSYMCGNLFVNLFVRLLYLTIGLYIRIMLYGTFQQDKTLTLTIPYVLIALTEAVYAIRHKLTNNYKYFSPPALITICYIFIGIVSNKFLGLGGDKNYLLYSDGEILNKVTLIVVGGLIFGKYLLPKSKKQSSRDASMIYIIFVGMALDNYEFSTNNIITSTKAEDAEAQRWLFVLWSYSLFPFGMNPLMSQSNAKKKNSVRARFKTCLQDDLSIFLMVFFQEIPYLIFRLKYLKIYEIDEMYNYSFNWATATVVMKNAALIFFFINRLVVYIFDENDDGKITMSDFIKMRKKATFKPTIAGRTYSLSAFLHIPSHVLGKILFWCTFGCLGAILVIIGLVIREKFLTEGKPLLYTKSNTTWHKWENQRSNSSYPFFTVQSMRDPNNPEKRKTFNQTEAKLTCVSSYNGTLAAITSESQQLLVYDLLKKQIIADFEKYPNDFSSASNPNFKNLKESREMAWIGGLRDEKIVVKQNRWMWVNQNLTIDKSQSYTNWYNDEQPNDQIDGNCMLMNVARRYETSVPGNFGKWDNEKCEKKLRYFVCQMEDKS